MPEVRLTTRARPKSYNKKPNKYSQLLWKEIEILLIQRTHIEQGEEGLLEGTKEEVYVSGLKPVYFSSFQEPLFTLPNMHFLRNNNYLCGLSCNQVETR